MPKPTLERAKQCLSEVLALNPQTISDDASLNDELGADSLDLVELMLVLEREWGVRLAQQDLRLIRQLSLSEEEIHVEEVLTPLALEWFREQFPVSQELFLERATRQQLGVLLTVRQVAGSVEQPLS